MSLNKDGGPLDSVRKAHEDEYFIKQNRELAAKLKARLDLEASGVKDEALIKELSDAGFSADSIRALFLAPLIEVAWADNRMDDEEKALIQKVIEVRGIETTSKANQILQNWLAAKPANDVLFTRALLLLEPIVGEIKKSGKNAGWILDAANKVALAAGGVFGFGGKVSNQEADVLKKLSDKLKS